jgi:integrase
MMNLTKRSIDAFKYQGPEPRRDIRWDDEISGFGIRIYPSGKKSFVLSYRNEGVKKLLVIGTYGVITLVQARDIAREKLGKLRLKIDPLEEKKKFSKSSDIKALAFIYIERHAKVHKKTWKEDERRLNQHIIPHWGARKVSSIKRNDIALLHSKIGQEAPYESNRIVRLLSKMFSLAIQWGILEEGAMNPASNIKLFKEKKRDRWLSPKELELIAIALNQEGNIYARYVLWFYLLTGARKSELLKARWEHVNWERMELMLPSTKSGNTHYIPLSTAALELLTHIPRCEGNPFVFPGYKKNMPLVNISKAWSRVRKSAGISDIRLHDLRRTVGSWLAQDGNSLHLIGKILNHSNTSTTAIYARFSQDQGREALEKHGNKIINFIKNN